MIFIGLHGKAGASKDTAADYLCHQHGWMRYALADPIRAGLYAMLYKLKLDGDITPELAPAVFTDRFLKEKTLPGIGKSPRQLMQTLGTEWGREMVHPRLWLILADATIERHRDQGGVGMVITDIRFPDEAEWIRSHGGKVWRITRTDTTPVNDHISEAGLPDHLIDLTINNNGTIKDLNVMLHTAFYDAFRS